MRLFQVDAFTESAFAGNPAAVCLLEQDRDGQWMQQVGAEMNLAETAFVRDRPDGSYDLRWFTPAVEVDLCGHATLAAAHVLWELGATDAVLGFETRSGRLTARRTPAGVELDFPAEPALPLEPGAVAAEYPGLAEALGAEPVWVGRNRFDLLVELADEATVRALTPDLAVLREYPLRGVIVTAAGEPDDSKADFVSRFFAPRYGVDEDPVTGSAHCCLAPYWSERLGRAELTGYQASPRGGRVLTRVAGERVLLTGGAVTLMRGELMQ
jgi:predicted PhzF superfamily epimerase YddE/YHI9